MWILLKAEFEYYKVSTLLYSIVFLLLMSAFLLWGQDRVNASYPALRSVMILIIFAMLISRQIKIAQEKMDSFYIRLPLALNNVALIRILYLSLFWIAMVTIFLSIFLITRASDPGTLIIRDLLSLTGIIFTAIAIPLIHRDLNIRFDGKNQKMIVGLIYIFVIASGYIFFMLFFLVQDSIKAFEVLAPYKEIVSKMSSGNTGVSAFLIVGIGCLALSALIFNKRNKYLD